MSADVIGYLDTGDGPPLLLRPGRRLAARVVRVEGERATVAVAGALLDVVATARLEPGATVRLVVHAVVDGRIALRLDDDAPPATGGLDVLA